ncbi:MAG: cytochrome c oxidase subunit I [Candidatus Rokuibacteriota bacterium]|nr:MAG: cytochrome c oxidase subunit I [Candidatus Rokubacteria bacterium]
MATQAAFMPGTRVTAGSVVWSWLTTVDHKRIGILYGTSAFIFFLIGGLEAIIMRMQLARPDNTLVGAQTFNELFTMHGTTMIFLAVMPLSASFFNFMIPLLIGARDVAFPRLNALSYWIFLSGALFLNASWLFGVAPDGGWFGYSNLSSVQFSPTHSIDFWMLGLQILGISSMLAGFNFIVTIINMRAPGMTLMRMPLFVWMSFVTNFLLVLAFPAITVALILLMFDRFFGTLFYNPSEGGDPLLWQHLFWIFGHPEVYILILPAMGIVSEVLPTFARKPLFGAPFVIFSGIMIGFFGFGVWSHHMFSVGMGPVADSAFSIATMLIAVPTGVKILNWIATLWGGALRFTSALYFSLGFIAMFTMGGLSGIMHASPPVDLQQTDTYFVVAHFHYVLFGGSIFGLFSGIYYWWPKITGRLLDERLGRWHFWLMLIGFNVTFFPQHFLGLIGMPRRIYTYAPDLGWNFWNLVSSIGSLIIALSFLIFIANVVRTLRSGTVSGPDPWDGRTLEWSIPSPPPVYNFALVPTVHDRDEFWLQKYGDGHGVKPAGRPRAATAQEIAAIHMPSPSYWPLVLALAVDVMISGLLLSTYQIIVGGLLTLTCMYKFAMEHHRPAPAHGH